MSVKCINDVDLEKHFFSTSSHDINQIIKPLVKHEITYFSYSRLHSNGIDDCLTNRSIAQKIFVDKKCYEQAFVGEIKQYTYCIVFWNDLAKENNAMTEYLSAMQSELNVGNGVVIVIPTDNVVEFYYFASTANNYKMNSFFMSNVDFLYSFIDYFNDIAKKLKEESYKNRVYYPGHCDQTVLTHCDFPNNLSRIANYKNTFMLMADYFQLSDREKECAQYVMQGLNCKQIASSLNLSTRTVEKHLKNLRNKTKSANFAQMTTKLYRINWVEQF